MSIFVLKISFINLNMNIIVPRYIFLPDATIKNDLAVILKSDGTIVEVLPINKINSKADNIKYHNGLLLPGLINCHCHLELSWCKGLYSPNTGIEAFYGAMKNIQKLRPNEDIINEAINNTIKIFKRQGVVAVADISNTKVSLEAKTKSDIYFHTFLEAFGMSENDAKSKLDNLIYLQKEFIDHKQSCSLSAHTLFTLSNSLMSGLMKHISDSGNMHSIHFSESQEEIQYFEKKRPIKNVHKNTEKQSIYNSAFEAASGLLPQKNKIVFVHNTFADKKCVENILKHFKDPWFCFCPSSNQFITNSLPDIYMINTLTSKILIGTDSLSSNNDLNMFKEIDLILKKFPELKVETLLKVATLNGANFMGIDKTYGSIEKNKKPGLILLENYQPGLRELSNLKIKLIA